MKEQPVPYQFHVLVCLNEKAPGEPSCGPRGGKDIAAALKKAVEEAGLKPKVRVSKTHCLGQCALGPNVMIYPEGRHFSNVSLEDVPRIVDRLKV